MAQTISFTPRSDRAFFTVDEVNLLFTQIKAVLDGKLDVRGAVVEGDISLRNGSILNIPVPTQAGDLLSVEDV